MNCETARGLFLDLAEGHLEPLAAADLRRHLGECPTCDIEYRKLRALVGDLSAARSVERAAWVTASAHAPPAPAPAPGRIGDFEILGEIGRGGMGVVYRARQISLNREVALKVLAGLSADDPRAVERFTKEAKAAARLHHTNIVPVYAQGCENGQFFYAMECIEGQSLDRVMREDRSFEKSAASHTAAPTIRLSESALLESAVATMLRARGPARDFRRIARLIAEVADALAHAHSHGIVHRDIKPQNLLLGADDRLHVTDFGLARILDEPGLTRTHEMLGTPAYMAPEQVRSGSKIDARTDVYALGVTLYELLTRERPFKAETYSQLIDCILNKEPRPPRSLDSRVPADLETICLRAMEKSPAARFASAGDMARDLRRFADDFPIQSRRIGPLGRSIRWIRRNPYRSAALLATVFLLATGGVAWKLLNAAANEKIDRAFDVLLADSRAHAEAEAALGWAAQWGGDRRRRALLGAFLDIRRDTPKAIDTLVRLRKTEPENADALCLLAWAYARRPATSAHAADCIRQVESLGVAPSAEGFFYLGMAILPDDPERAVTIFDRAIDSRDGFVHAMLHQARAMNYCLYYYRDLKYYEKAKLRLTNAAMLQPRSPWPRYYLARCHTLAGEIYAASNRPQDAARAFDEAVSAAEDARKVDPSSPRGPIAEGQALESRGRFSAALAAFRRLDAPGISLGPGDRAERFSYELRVRFALRDYDAAEELVALRLAIDPNPEARAEAVLLRTLISLARTGRAAAKPVFDAELEKIGKPDDLPVELRLMLSVLSGVVGTPSSLPAVPFGPPLPPGWDSSWTSNLVDYVAGRRDWPDLVASAKTLRREQTQQRLAAAWFLRGLLALGRDDDTAAGQAFGEGARQYDNERYCYWCRLLAYRFAPHAFPGDDRE